MKKQTWKWVLILFFGLAGCYPVTSRTNARIESGFEGALKVGANIALGAKGSSTTGSPKANWVADVEGDFQVGYRMENNLGFAFQVKIPSFVYASTIDAYLELPSPHPLYYGVGFETPIATFVKDHTDTLLMPYGTITLFWNKSVYTTLTSRPVFSTSKSFGNLSFSNQITIGEAEKTTSHDEFGETGFSSDMFLYIAHNYFSGDGIDVNPCFENCTPDRRNNTIQVGVGARF